jgi:DNA modification methylase
MAAFANIPIEQQVYSTMRGLQVCGDSREVLRQLEPETVDLIITSPPFALLREKTYGNKSQEEYISWLCEFGRAAFPALKETGSFVIDLGGSYERGKPVRSLYNFRVLLEFCDRVGYRFAEDFYWFNPAKLPSPIEWVNRRKMRAKDSVNTVWWFSRGDWPKANVSHVLTPYSERMKELLKNPDAFYSPAKRPSGHDISKRFGDSDNAGAIPSNLLQIPNTDSNSHYMRTLKSLQKERHPARFPAELPAFFIKFLTDPNDLVVDIFSGSNTTGYAAENLGRRWLSVELERSYAVLSSVRFMEGQNITTIRQLVSSIASGNGMTLEPVVSPNPTSPNGKQETGKGTSLS